MTTYTYSEARQNLSSVLDKAKEEGQIIIKRKDGTYFKVCPIIPNTSPLDIPGIDVDITAAEILDFIADSRKRYEDPNDN